MIYPVSCDSVPLKLLSRFRGPLQYVSRGQVILHTFSEVSSSGRLSCSGRYQGVKSLDGIRASRVWTVQVLWTGKECPESGHSAVFNPIERQLL